MQLTDLVTAGDVVFDVHAANVGDAAAELLRATLPHHGYAQPEIERLIAAVQAREREAPTLCGAIAIPHARDANVAEFALAIGINRSGITGDGSPRLMFAFLSPEPRRSEHLDLLARLARLSRNDAAVHAILNATTRTRWWRRSAHCSASRSASSSYAKRFPKRAHRTIVSNIVS